MFSDFTNINSLNNWDLLVVGIVVAATFVLGFSVYLNDKKNITNRTFLFFSIVTAIWGVVNYASYNFTNPILVLWLYRLIMFFAVLQAFSLYKLFLVFPVDRYEFSNRHKRILFPFVVLVSILTLTPFVFSGIEGVPVLGQVAIVNKEPGLMLFALLAVGLVIKSIYILFSKIKKANSKSERNIFKLMLWGIMIMFLCIIIFNLILPTVFLNTRFLPLGALFVFPFIIFTSSAIYKHNLFHIKIASITVVSFILTVFSLLNILYTKNSSQIILNVTFFLGILIGSITLIKSVLKEVEQKEELAKLNVDLQALLKQRESLVHLVTHKVKGSFTRSKYLFAGILDGTFGEVNEEVKRRAAQGLEFENTGIDTVDLVLNAANLQTGTVKYEMKKLDFKDIVKKVLEDKKVQAEAKGLKLLSKIDEEKSDIYAIMGDKFWLTEAVNNLVDNSIKYTKEGEIMVTLHDGGGKIRFEVKDTGIGITDEDKQNLFTEGGRGKNSVKVNVDSTGYGLYSVKLIVEAHKGRVWGESDGPSKGSTFHIELDSVNEK